MVWRLADMPDQTGRVFVVTGANSGIGFEAAKALSRKGARVVMACRNRDKAEAARAEVGGDSEVRELDLGSLESVRAFAAAWEGRIDVLVNNAGIMAVPFARTVDGFESQYGTNFLGPFALTGLLLPQVTDRVVTLSSGVHRMGRIDLADPGFERRRYQRWTAYGQSKLADLMFAYELQRRLLLAGSPVRSMAAHPGYAATNLQRNLGSAVSTWQDWMQRIGLVQDAAGGALPTLYAATAPDLPGGSYVGPSGPLEQTGPPRIVGSSAGSRDLDTQYALWELAVRLTGVDPGLPGTLAGSPAAREASHTRL
jgi:NAD(P)-dependent dehydrogenase (short-subunit alcohol dehydrogenase family)